MSRCYPYPPPGYALKSALNPALIESIKLQKEKEKANEERKIEKKREKEEKKRKKEGKKRKKEEKEKFKFNGVEKRECDAEQLERSGITHEYGQPVWSQNASYASDSSQNSKKRQRDASPPSSFHAYWNTVRIRLSLQKCQEVKVSTERGELCSISGQIESSSDMLGPPAGKNEFYTLTENMDGPGNMKYGIVARAAQACNSTPTGHVERQPRRCDNEEPRSTSGSTKSHDQRGLRIGSRGSRSERKMRKVESLYKDLVEKLAPQILHTELPDVDEDQEWLFGGNHQDEHIGEKIRVSSDICRCGFSTLCPPSPHLLEVDLYALPYTVPY